MKWKFKWEGPRIVELSMDAIMDIMSDAGLDAEGNSKRELYKGHGVVTGTLRRSIHAAPYGYGWAGDSGGGEMGGRRVRPTRQGHRVVLEVGTGLGYAMPVHQGHHSFAGYHFMTNGVNKTKGSMPGIIARHRLK